MTIAERFTRTTSRTARLMLQDRAAVYGAQDEIREPFELMLQAAEALDKELHNDTSEPTGALPATHRHSCPIQYY